MRTSSAYTLVYSLIKLTLVAIWFVIFMAVLSIHFLFELISVFTESVVNYLKNFGHSLQTLPRYKTLVMFDYIVIGIAIISGIYFMWVL